MSGEWKNFIAAQGLAGDGLSFGHGAAELAAAREGIFRWFSRSPPSRP